MMSLPGPPAGVGIFDNPGCLAKEGDNELGSIGSSVHQHSPG